MAQTDGKIQQTNTFAGGINSDLAPEILPTNEALAIRNLRVVSDNTSDNGFGTQSGKSYRLQTQKGHEIEFTIPDVPAISRWQICYEVEDPTQEASFQASITAIDGACVGSVDDYVVTFSPDGTTNLGAFVDTLNTLGDSCGGPLVFAFTQCNCILLYSTRVNGLISQVTITNRINVAVTVNTVDLPAQSDLEVIGEVSNGQELILFTTSSTNVDPFTIPEGNVGQVWQLDISKYSSPVVCTLGNLRFTDYVNFALRKQIQAVYTVETECIRRLTWTDNFNPVRTITLDGESGLIVKVPDTLNLQPEVQFGNIDYLGFGSGSLLTGVYRVAYRLITADGNATPFTPLSNPINVLNNSTTPYRDYEGGGVNTPSERSIIVQFNDLDTRFTQLEVAVAFYITNASPPSQVFIAYRGSFSQVQNLEIQSNVTIYGDIPFEEVVDNPLQIANVKNLLVNTNRLILSNYCVKTGIDISKVTWGLPTYTIRRVLADTTINTTDPALLAGGPWIGAEQGSDPFYDTASVGVNSGIPDFDYNNDFADYKGSQTAYYVRTHPRGEVLRIGIMFYLISGSTTPVYYIGDINTPTVKAEELTEVIDGNLYLRVLGIEVPNIDVTQIASEIRGYSVVVAKLDRTVAGQGVLFNYEASSNNPSQYAVRYNVGFNNSPADCNDLRYALYSPDYDFLQDIKGDLEVEVLGSLPTPASWAVNLGQLIYKFYTYNVINSTVTESVKSISIIPNATAPNAGGFTLGQYAHVLLDAPALNNLSQLSAQQGPLLVNIRVNKNDPYGGTSETALAATQYRYCGHFQPINNCSETVHTATVFGGETFIVNYDRILRYIGGALEFGVLATGFFLPVEAHFNSMLRESIVNAPSATGQSWTLLRRQATPFVNTDTVYGLEPFIYESVWSFDASTFEKAIALQPTQGNCETCFPTGIIPSAPKAYGELINSFGNLLENDAVQADVQYGGINQMLSLDRNQREVYIWQDTAFQMYPFGQQSLQVTSGQEVQTGTGTLFGPPVLISTSAGSLHKWSTIKGNDTFFWISDPVRRLYSYNGQQLVDLPLKGQMRTWFERNLHYVSDLDNPVFDGGYHAAYDYRHNEVLFTYRINPSNLPQDTVVEFYVPDSCWAGHTRLLIAQFNEVNVLPEPVDFDGTPEGLIRALQTSPVYNSFQYVIQDSGIIITGLPVSTVLDLIFGEQIGQGENKACRFAPYGDNVQWTISWSELVERFNSTWSFWPKIYIPIAGNRLLSPNPASGSDIYQHAKSTQNYTTFYGTVYDAWFEYVVNNGGIMFTKTPQAIITDMNDRWTRIQAVSNYVRSAYDGAYRMKSDYPMLIFEPSGGKWMSSFIPANKIQPLGSPDQFIEPTVMLGELLFVRFINQDSNYKDIGQIQTQIGVSRTNRTNLK